MTHKPVKRRHNNSIVPPKKVQKHGYTFDSITEFKVYNKIHAYVPDIEIHKDHVIKSSRTGILSHNVDFYLPKHLVWIEAKGSVVDDRFMRILQEILILQPHFLPNYWVTVNGSIIKSLNKNKFIRECRSNGMKLTTHENLSTLLSQLR